MDSSSSVLPQGPVRNTLRPLWSLALGVRPGGVALAREKGWVLAWDEKDSLHLLNGTGARQAQRRTPTPLAAACCADDGSAYAVVGKQGEIWWLAPDLSVRWEQAVSNRKVAAALDPFGQYLAVADADAGLCLFDRHGRLLFQVRTERPLHHLAFVPAAPFLVGSADYGLVACFDLAGHCVWRNGLVAHIGALAVSGTGEQVVLACFTEGLQRYNLAGKDEGRLQLAEPCRLSALSFDGRVMLVAGLSNRLLLCDRKGRIHYDYVLDKPAAAVALGALGESAVVALADGRLLGLDLHPPSPP